MPKRPSLLGEPFLLTGTGYSIILNLCHEASGHPFLHSSKPTFLYTSACRSLQARSFIPHISGNGRNNIQIAMSNTPFIISFSSASWLPSKASSGMHHMQP
jgi:hypothetical protein